MHPAGAIASPLRKIQLKNPSFVISAHPTALHFDVSHEYIARLYTTFQYRCDDTSTGAEALLIHTSVLPSPSSGGPLSPSLSTGCLPGNPLRRSGDECPLRSSPAFGTDRAGNSTPPTMRDPDPPRDDGGEGRTGWLVAAEGGDTPSRRFRGPPGVIRERGSGRRPMRSAASASADAPPRPPT